ncbi:hypothetical protein [Stenotrophomonas sp.]|uniref:hypothetical protein n=1 Tax=Stenotrophomonas sp. TaxID=69392 RepID=UPI0028A5A93F|nr:hypothetical protein [Stenotrophomonas sp.]
MSNDNKPTAAQEAVALIENARAATDFSTNYATAKPDIGNTEKEHILGLCRVVTGLVAHIEAAPVAAAPVDPSKLGAAMKAFDDAGGHATSYAPAWMRKALEAASTPAAPGIDLSRLAGEVRATADDWISRGVAGNAVMKHFADQLEAVLIDASPNGGSIEPLAVRIPPEKRWMEGDSDYLKGHADGYNVALSDVVSINACISKVKPAMQATSAEVGS